MGKQIVIVGAGVIGLTCAWVLSEEGYDVTIIAEKFPSTFNGEIDHDYTSPWAGAHFRPFPSMTEGDLKDFPLTRVTYEIMKKISIKYPESSIKFMKGIDYVEADEEAYATLKTGYADGLHNFTILKDLPTNVKFGAEYDTWCLNSPLYLQFLERRLRMHFGVEFIIAKLMSLRQASQLFPSAQLINCSGLGLKYDGGFDDKCYQVRGQTLLVKAPKECSYKNMTITHRLPNGKFSFVIPRPLDGGIIVGGTRQPLDFNHSSNDFDTTELISNAITRFPELVVYRDNKPTLDVVKINVGFRPMRVGGTRIEREVIDETTIVHCYGFGSSGFEMSWGAAEIVAKLVSTINVKL
ncbi:hypothetical protein CANINC_002679 [Pichia inconspicua]|uniref:FAD dependent oxidoreductase domain-containing protein n=1 Tax=Pichia inconspicua TaxID=52247 RepID=A0A4T0X0L7_9ASCO|nr:hypothetical protein CANINC_002679 [[Candida] inconspicua]